jgi:hypothetical protein
MFPIETQTLPRHERWLKAQIFDLYFLVSGYEGSLRRSDFPFNISLKIRKTRATITMMSAIMTSPLVLMFLLQHYLLNIFLNDRAHIIPKAWLV